MDHTKIDSALGRLFDEQGHRIVFWNDPDREFQNDLWLLKLDNVQIVRLDQVGALEAKIRIERDEPDTRFLLYSPAEEPDLCPSGEHRP